MTDIYKRLERSALLIAAHELQRENEELKRSLLNARQGLIAVEAERDSLLQKVAALPDTGLRRKYEAAAAEAEEYLDFLRSTKQLVAFGYWKQRKRELLDFQKTA